MSESTAKTSVDIVLPAFNAETSIVRAAESVLGDPALGQLIIVDDASTDNTADRIRELAEAHSKVRAILLETNVGPAEARNIGVSHSNAEWVALLDSDDWMDENRISTLLAHALDSGADIVADDIFMHLPNGESASVWSPEPFSPFFISAAFFAQMNMEAFAGTAREFGYIKPLFRASSLKRSGAPWQKSLRIMEDYDLYLRCLIAGDQFLFTPRAGYHYDRGIASRAFRPEALSAVVEIDRGFARQVEDKQSRYWIGRHADDLEATLLWVDLVGGKNFRSVPNLLARSILRPAIAKSLFGRLSRKLQGRSPDAPRQRHIPKGSPADFGGV